MVKLPDLKENIGHDYYFWYVFAYRLQAVFKH